jgi:hypothetical protein
MKSASDFKIGEKVRLMNRFYCQGKGGKVETQDGFVVGVVVAITLDYIDLRTEGVAHPYNDFRVWYKNIL